jgi:DNA-binding NarL/FixJ family response regulator
MAPLERYTLFVDLHQDHCRTTPQALAQTHPSLALVRVDSIPEVQARLAQHPPDLLLMDLRSGDSPAQFLQDYRQAYPDSAPLMLAIADQPPAHGSVGASNFDGYLVEPIDRVTLSQLLSLASTRRQLASGDRQSNPALQLSSGA